MERILAGLRDKLKQHTLAGLSERNTDRVFVSPLLEALGYDLANLNETIADYHLKDVENGSEISYAFFNRQRLIMLLEIRPLYSDLSSLKNMAKVLATAEASGAPILVLCNGVEWLIYDICGKTADPELVARIDVREEYAARYLEDMKMSRLSANGLERMKDSCRTLTENGSEVQYGQVKNRGYKISELCHASVNRLKTQIMTQRDVKDQEITNSLIVENLIRVFIEGVDKFNFYDISNEKILKKRIEESLQRRFSQ